MDTETKRMRCIVLQKLDDNYPHYLWEYWLIRYHFKCQTKHQTLKIFLDYKTLTFREFNNKYKKVYKDNMPDMLNLNTLPRDKLGHQQERINKWNITRVQVKNLLTIDRPNNITKILFNI